MLIQLAPCMANLLFSAWITWCFRRYPRPPLWTILCLLTFGIGSIRLLFIGELSQFAIVLLTVLSAVFCIMLALALSCRRWLGSSHPRSWIITAMVVLPAIVCADLRFRINVIDENGNAVEVDANRIELQTSRGCVFYQAHGNRLKKGVVYFGFCQWVMHRENWDIFGHTLSPTGLLLCQKNIQINGRWQNWPLRITVDTKSS